MFREGMRPSEAEIHKGSSGVKPELPKESMDIYRNLFEANMEGIIKDELKMDKLAELDPKANVADVRAKLDERKVDLFEKFLDTEKKVGDIKRLVKDEIYNILGIPEVELEEEVVAGEEEKVA